MLSVSPTGATVPYRGMWLARVTVRGIAAVPPRVCRFLLTGRLSVRQVGGGGSERRADTKDTAKKLRRKKKTDAEKEAGRRVGTHAHRSRPAFRCKVTPNDNSRHQSRVRSPISQREGGREGVVSVFRCGRFRCSAMPPMEKTAPFDALSDFLRRRSSAGAQTSQSC